MLSVYHASARSKRESPVAKGAPFALELAGYNSWIRFKVAVVSLESSIRSLRMKSSKAASSCPGGTPRPETFLLNPVPSLVY